MTAPNTETLRQTLRQLAELARERELEQHLARLYQYFQLWRTMEIDNFEMLDMIEQFHKEVATDLNQTYDLMDDNILVTKALAQGLLDKEEVPVEILQRIYRQAQ